MTHGRPDFTTSINITGQELAEVISRPKYGAAEDAYGNWILHEEQAETLISIAGTGMIYGGYIWVKDLSYGTRCALNVEIDGHAFQGHTPAGLNLHMIDSERSYHFYEKYYSEENETYSIGIMSGITFEESWMLDAENLLGSGSDILVVSTIIYALI